MSHRPARNHPYAVLAMSLLFQQSQRLHRRRESPPPGGSITIEFLSGAYYDQIVKAKAYKTTENTRVLAT